MGRISEQLKDKERICVPIRQIEDGIEKSVICCGYEVRALCTDWTGIRQIEFESADGMVTALSVEEILEASPGRRVLLINEEEGIPCQWRLVVEGDSFKRRWCKEIIHIETVEEACENL